MSDQADTLRRLMKEREGEDQDQTPGEAQILTLCSARKQVGKTAVMRSLGAVFSRSGSRVLQIESRRPSASEKNSADFILIEAVTDFSAPVLKLYSPKDVTVLILTAQAGEVADTCSWLKLLRREAGLQRFGVIVNQVTDGQEGQRVFKKLNDLAGRFTEVQLDYLGHLHSDEKFKEAVMNQNFLINLYSKVPAVPCLELVAKRLKNKHLGKDDFEVTSWA